MTSKSSFWVDLKENNKRRIAVWVVSILTFMLCMPTYMAFSLNRWSMRLEQYIREYGAELAEKKLLFKLQEVAEECIALNEFHLVFVTVIALLAGVHGFSWLYSRKKIDFYMGMPVKKKDRFLRIWLNGILIYLIPYLLGQVISLSIAAGYGAVNADVLKAALMAVGVNLLFYLGVYHVAILAVMLTGNVLITLCGFGVLCLYEFVIRMLIYSYSSMFFRYYSYMDEQNMPKLSPFTMYSDFGNAWESGIGMFGIVIKLLAFALVVGVIAYVCYKKRPAEAAGKAMAFPVTRSFVKILIVIPVTLLAGYVMAEAVNYYPKEDQEGLGFVLFAMAMTVLIGSGLMQVIYEFDIKGALHKKYHILISGVAVALIFLSFRYDLTGFDSYVPAPEKVESVAFVPDTFESSSGYMPYVNEQGNFISGWTYAKDKMYLTNTEDICELAAYAMEQYDQVFKIDNAQDLGLSDAEYMKEYQWSTVSLRYRMKSGREVVREIKVNVKDEKTLALLDKILSTEEFKVGYFQGAGDGMLKYLADNEKYTVEPFCGNLIYSNLMEKEDAAEFFEIYREDIKEASFMEIRNSVPENMVLVDVTQENSNGGRYTYTAGVNVYSFMENSVNYLKEKGYYVENAVDLEDIEYITVYNSNSEIREQLREQERSGNGVVVEEKVAVESVRATMEADPMDTGVYAEYTQQEEMSQIAEYIYPRELIGYQWDGGVPVADDYEVVVYFKRDSAMAKVHGRTCYYGFLEGEVPAFVAEDTMYRIEE